MIRMCSWCGKYMGQKDPLGDPKISHMICPDCEGIMNEEIKKNGADLHESPGDQPGNRAVL